MFLRSPFHTTSFLKFGHPPNFFIDPVEIDLLDFSEFSDKASNAFFPFISEASAPSGREMLMPEIVLLIDFELSMENLLEHFCNEEIELASVLLEPTALFT